jgi:hypothetical protein
LLGFPIDIIAPFLPSPVTEFLFDRDAMERSIHMTLHSGWRLVGASVMMLLAANTAYGKNDRDACPPPFVFAGHKQPDKHTRCILPRDATIDARS